MPPLVSLIATTMFCVSLLVAAVLAIAWRDFGRTAQALTWSVAALLVALLWALRLLTGSSSPLVVVPLGAIAAALNTIGFRQRARVDPWILPLLSSVVVPATAAALLAGWLPGTNGMLLLYLYDGLLFWIAAGSLGGGRRRGERAQLLARIGLTSLAGGSVALGLLHALGPLLGWAAAVDVIDAGLLLMLPVGTTGIGLFTIYLLAADLAQETRRLAATDQLTGVLNRRGFDAEAARLLTAARIRGRAVTLALIDVDRFKDINDSFGHPEGDRVLAAFTEVLRGELEQRDIVARIGGEEFAILMADVGATRARGIAEGARASIAAHDFALEDGRAVTASFGLATLTADTPTLAGLLDRADAALYAAKQRGRNRVETGAAPIIGTAAR